MRQRSINNIFNNMALQYIGAIVLAAITSSFNSQLLTTTADTIANSFIFILKWCSIPMITLAILSAASGLNNKAELFTIGRRVVKYTLLTTTASATVALLIFIVLNPTNYNLAALDSNLVARDCCNTFGILLLVTTGVAILLSITVLYLKPTTKLALHHKLVFCYKKFMVAIQMVIKLMPIAIWAFVCIFIREVNGLVATSILLYLACIIIANLIQAFIVLPLLLYRHGISAPKLATAMWPAINIAFWSKSSGIALPMAINCAINKAKLNEKIAKFSLPVCTTINMNACSAFILITVLFISTSHGIHYSNLELIAWVGIATIAAIGNASVPMGCFTMAMALLTFTKVPLHVMGLILPFYAIIDMLESAINIWSDACVTAIVNAKN